MTCDRLGLSVVYGIIKQHEGWINVYSEPGQGSTFKIYLPIVSSITEKHDKAEAMPSLQELQGRGERILVVEDEKAVGEFALKALCRSGYNVYKATRVQEARDIFEKENGNFHLVFSDVVLPDGTGIQLVEELLSKKHDLSVLLCSGYTDQKSHWPIIREKGYRFVQKPYALNDLLEVVKEVLCQQK